MSFIWIAVALVLVLAATRVFRWRARAEGQESVSARWLAQQRSMDRHPDG
jgi:hypothetical protein